MTFSISGREYDDVDTVERQLSALFIDMCNELGIDHGDDAVAWRTDFNNWTDSLCKAGLICEQSYDQLCPVGDRFE